MIKIINILGIIFHMNKENISSTELYILKNCGRYCDVVGKHRKTPTYDS